MANINEIWDDMFNVELSCECSVEWQQQKKILKVLCHFFANKKKYIDCCLACSSKWFKGNRILNCRKNWIYVDGEFDKLKWLMKYMYEKMDKMVEWGGKVPCT